MRQLLRILGILLGLSLGLLAVVSAQAAAINVSPNGAHPGDTITVSGNVLLPNGQAPDLPSGASVTLTSAAFVGRSVSIPVQGPQSMYPGAFTGKVRIRPDAGAPVTYPINGTFAGRKLEVQGSITLEPAAAAPAPAPTAPQPQAPATAQPAAPTPPATAQPTAPGLPNTGAQPADSVPWPGWLPPTLVVVGSAGVLGVLTGWLVRRRDSQL